MNCMRESNRLHVWIAEHPLLGFDTGGGLQGIAAANRAAHEAKRVMMPRRCADSAARMSLRTLRILMEILTAQFIRSDMPRQFMFFIVSRRNHDMESLQNKRDLDLIRERLKRAEELHQRRK